MSLYICWQLRMLLIFADRCPKIRRRQWQPTPVLLSGKFHGWRSLVGYSSRGHKESDKAKQLHCYAASLTMPKPLTVWTTTNWKILKEMGIPDHLTCLLRNLYADQEATFRTGHGTTDWSILGKEYIKAIYCHPA